MSELGFKKYLFLLQNQARLINRDAIFASRLPPHNDRSGGVVGRTAGGGN